MSETTAAAPATPAAAIHLTPRAAAKVREIREAEGLGESHGLRLQVVGGGCSGLQYALGFEEAAGPTDRRFDHEGLPVYVDEISLGYLRGTTVDYVEGLAGAGFKFSNPNAQASCGCGESFACG